MSAAAAGVTTDEPRSVPWGAGRTRMEGAIVVVTGASTGIGLGVARAAVRKGARAVVMMARRDMTAIAEELGAGNDTDVIPISVDLTQFEAVERACNEVRERCGVPDVIVFSSASGGFECIEEIDPADFVRAMSACVFASFFVTRCFIDEWLQRNGGHFVFVGSGSYLMKMPFEGYLTRMSALRGFYRSLQTDLELDPDNRIRFTWCEPPNVRDNSYYDNNPGVRERLPRAGEDPRMQMASCRIGEHITASVEAGKSVWRTAIVSVMMFLYAHTPLSRLIDRILGDFRPPEEGGPPCGHRRRSSSLAAASIPG